MGQVLTPDLMPDVVIAIFDDLNKGKWVGEMTDLQEHVGFYRIARDKREQAKAGRGIEVRIVTDHNNSAQHVGLFNTMEYNRSDAMAKGRVPWTYTDGHMVFDEREEAFQGDETEIVDLVEVEQARMMTSIIELSEADVWGKPSSSAVNDTPFGMAYWVTKHATVGFNGGDPSGFTAGRAGLSSTDYPRHKNFTGGYTSVGDTEDTGLVWMMEKGADYTRWVNPDPEVGMGQNMMPKRGIFCNWITKNRLKNVAKANNDSLGFDLSTQSPTFRGSKITYVPYFNDDSTNPLYMIDFNHFYAKFLKNWFLKRKKVKQLAKQPHCFAIIVSMAWNIVCDDLRRQAVFYDAS